MANDARHNAMLCESTRASRVIKPGSEKCSAIPYERLRYMGLACHCHMWACTTTSHRPSSVKHRAENEM